MRLPAYACDARTGAGMIPCGSIFGTILPQNNRANRGKWRHYGQVWRIRYEIPNDSSRNGVLSFGGMRDTGAVPLRTPTVHL